MNDSDWRAITNSEIFSEFVAIELKKEAANKKTAEQIADEELKTLNDFEEFQNKINASKKQKAEFKKLQVLFQTNEKFAATVDPGFVEAVLLLNID